MSENDQALKIFFNAVDAGVSNKDAVALVTDAGFIWPKSDKDFLARFKALRDVYLQLSNNIQKAMEENPQIDNLGAFAEKLNLSEAEIFIFSDIIANEVGKRRPAPEIVMDEEEEKSPLVDERRAALPVAEKAEDPVMLQIYRGVNRVRTLMETFDDVNDIALTEEDAKEDEKSVTEWFEREANCRSPLVYSKKKVYNEAKVFIGYEGCQTNLLLTAMDEVEKNKIKIRQQVPLAKQADREQLQKWQDWLDDVAQEISATGNQRGMDDTQYFQYMRKLKKYMLSKDAEEDLDDELAAAVGAKKLKMLRAQVAVFAAALKKEAEKARRVSGPNSVVNAFWTWTFLLEFIDDPSMIVTDPFYEGNATFRRLPLAFREQWLDLNPVEQIRFVAAIFDSDVGGVRLLSDAGSTGTVLKSFADLSVLLQKFVRATKKAKTSQGCSVFLKKDESAAVIRDEVTTNFSAVWLGEKITSERRLVRELASSYGCRELAIRLPKFSAFYIALDDALEAALADPALQANELQAIRDVLFPRSKFAELLQKWREGITTWISAYRGPSAPGGINPVIDKFLVEQKVTDILPFVADEDAKGELQKMRETFGRSDRRDFIYEVINKLQEAGLDIGNGSKANLQRMKNTIREIIPDESPELQRDARSFLISFINNFGGLNTIPRGVNIQTGRPILGFLFFSSVKHLPETLREGTYNRVSDVFAGSIKVSVDRTQSDIDRLSVSLINQLLWLVNTKPVDFVNGQALASALTNDWSCLKTIEDKSAFDSIKQDLISAMEKSDAKAAFNCVQKLSSISHACMEKRQKTIMLKNPLDSTLTLRKARVLRSRPAPTPLGFRGLPRVDQEQIMWMKNIAWMKVKARHNWEWWISPVCNGKPLVQNGATPYVMCGNKQVFVGTNLASRAVPPPINSDLKNKWIPDVDWWKQNMTGPLDAQKLINTMTSAGGNDQQWIVGIFNRVNGAVIAFDEEDWRRIADFQPGAWEDAVDKINREPVNPESASAVKDYLYAVLKSGALVDGISPSDEKLQTIASDLATGVMTHAKTIKDLADYVAAIDSLINPRSPVFNLATTFKMLLLTASSEWRKRVVKIDYEVLLPELFAMTPSKREAVSAVVKKYKEFTSHEITRSMRSDLYSAKTVIGPKFDIADSVVFVDNSGQRRTGKIGLSEEDGDTLSYCPAAYWVNGKKIECIDHEQLAKILSGESEVPDEIQVEIRQRYTLDNSDTTNALKLAIKALADSSWENAYKNPDTIPVLLKKLIDAHPELQDAADTANGMQLLDKEIDKRWNKYLKEVVLNEISKYPNLKGVWQLEAETRYATNSNLGEAVGDTTGRLLILNGEISDAMIKDVRTADQKLCDEWKKNNDIDPKTGKWLYNIEWTKDGEVLTWSDLKKQLTGLLIAEWTDKLEVALAEAQKELSAEEREAVNKSITTAKAVVGSLQEQKWNAEAEAKATIKAMAEGWTAKRVPTRTFNKYKSLCQNLEPMPSLQFKEGSKLFPNFIEIISEKVGVPVDSLQILEIFDWALGGAPRPTVIKCDKCQQLSQGGITSRFATSAEEMHVKHYCSYVCAEADKSNYDGQEEEGESTENIDRKAIARTVLSSVFSTPSNREIVANASEKLGLSPVFAKAMTVKELFAFVVSKGLTGELAKVLEPASTPLRNASTIILSDVADSSLYNLLLAFKDRYPQEWNEVTESASSKLDPVNKLLTALLLEVWLYQQTWDDFITGHFKDRVLSAYKMLHPEITLSSDDIKRLPAIWYALVEKIGVGVAMIVPENLLRLEPQITTLAAHYGIPLDGDEEVVKTAFISQSGTVRDTALQTYVNFHRKQAGLDREKISKLARAWTLFILLNKIITAALGDMPSILADVGKLLPKAFRYHMKTTGTANYFSGVDTYGAPVSAIEDIVETEVQRYPNPMDVNLHVLFDIIGANFPETVINSVGDKNELEASAFSMLNMLGKAYFYGVGKFLVKDPKVNWKKIDGKYVLSKPYMLTDDVIRGVVAYMQDTTLNNIKDRLRRRNPKWDADTVNREAVSLYRTQGFEAELHKLKVLEARQKARDRIIRQGWDKANTEAKSFADAQVNQYIQQFPNVSTEVRNKIYQNYLRERVVAARARMLGEVEYIVGDDPTVKAVDDEIVESFDLENLKSNVNYEYFRALLDIASTNATLYRQPVSGEEIVPGSILSLSPYYRWTGIKADPGKEMKFQIAVLRVLLDVVSSRVRVQQPATLLENLVKDQMALARTAANRRAILSAMQRKRKEAEQEMPAQPVAKPGGMQRRAAAVEEPVEQAVADAAPAIVLFVYKLVDYIVDEFALPQKDRKLILKELDEAEFYAQRVRSALEAPEEVEVDEQEEVAAPEVPLGEEEAEQEAEEAPQEKEEQVEVFPAEEAPEEEEEWVAESYEPQERDEEEEEDYYRYEV
jgi:hypothetical protein